MGTKTFASSHKNLNFWPKKAKFGPKNDFLVILGQILAFLLVGGCGARAGCVSQDTYLLYYYFSWCTVRVAKRIGCQHTELVKDEKADTLIMEGETRPGKRTASLDVF